MFTGAQSCTDIMTIDSDSEEVLEAKTEVAMNAHGIPMMFVTPQPGETSNLVEMPMMFVTPQPREKSNREKTRTAVRPKETSNLVVNLEETPQPDETSNLVVNLEETPQPDETSNLVVNLEETPKRKGDAAKRNLELVLKPCAPLHPLPDHLGHGPETSLKRKRIRRKGNPALWLQAKSSAPLPANVNGIRDLAISNGAPGVKKKKQANLESATLGTLLPTWPKAGRCYFHAKKNNTKIFILEVSAKQTPNYQDWIPL